MASRLFKNGRLGAVRTCKIPVIVRDGGNAKLWGEAEIHKTQTS